MSSKKPNIAIVVLDTLRKDAFDRHFDWLNGTRYENAWSTSHWTPPSHASLFTGRYGSELGVHGKSKHMDCSELTISELLQREGWNTRGYSNNVHISHWFNFDRGFDEFHNDEHGDDLGFNWAEFISNHRHDGPARYFKLFQKVYESDAPTIPTLKQGMKIKLEDLGIIDGSTRDSGATETLRWIRQTSWNSSGEFLFINLMEAHAPYDAPKEYQTVDPTTIDGPKATITGSPEADVDHIKTAYDDCVKYLSDIYKKIHNELTNEFDVIVTVSDHGEAFGEYGGWEHFSGLWPAVTHIPLVISTSGSVDEPIETGAPVSLLDVHATVCSYARINPVDGSRGHSLDSVFDRTNHLIETHGLLSTARERLAEEGISETVLDQYDVELRGVADNGGYTFENFDGELTDHNGGVDDAKCIIEKLATQINARNTEGSEFDVPDHVENRLKDLGYR